MCAPFVDHRVQVSVGVRRRRAMADQQFVRGTVRQLVDVRHRGAIGVHRIPIDRAAEAERLVRAARARQPGQFGHAEARCVAEAARESELDQRAVVGVQQCLAARDRFRQRVVGDEVREKSFGRFHAPCVRHGGQKRLLAKSRPQLVGVDDGRLLRRQQQQIALGGMPRIDIREDRADRGVDGPDRLRVDVVRLHPLCEDAAGIEPRRGGAIELLSEETGDAGAIGVRRFGKDDVVAAARREQHLARVADANVHLAVVEHVVIDRTARRRDAEDRRLELRDVDAVHARNRSEPAGRAARTETDHQRGVRSRMNCRGHQARHDLRARIAAGAAVRLAVDHECVIVRVEQGHAALAAVDVPQQHAAELVFPIAQMVDAVAPSRATGADARMAPDRGWAERDEHRRDGGDRNRARNDSAHQDRGDREKDHDQLPRAGHAEERQKSESAGQRAGDGARRVPRVRQADV